jgi:hypothetical protein
MLKAMLQYGFMAAYSCPSRKEVDEVHYRSRFLHVGSLSPERYIEKESPRGTRIAIELSSVSSFVGHNNQETLQFKSDKSSYNSLVGLHISGNKRILLFDSYRRLSHQSFIRFDRGQLPPNSRHLIQNLRKEDRTLICHTVLISLLMDSQMNSFFMNNINYPVRSLT